MIHSDSLAKLAPALVAAQAEVTHAIKDSKNPHFGNTFASLNSVIDAVKPTFLKHGLVIIQIPGFTDGHLTLSTRLLHESGEWIEGDSGAPLAKDDPQGIGSATTYCRRYSLAAIAQIGQEDDDGNAASTAPTHAAPKQSADDMIECPKCGKEMWDNRVGKTNPKSPDLKCKDKEGCNNAIWLGTWGPDLGKEIEAAHKADSIDAKERDQMEGAIISRSPAMMLRVATKLDSLASGGGLPY